MKIVHIETLFKCGSYANSPHWEETRGSILAAAKKCDWPPGSGRFTINPTRQGNGVVPIKREFIRELKKRAWIIEGRAKNHLGNNLGDFDAVLQGPDGAVVAEWETGNISSSHRSMNKLTMLIANGIVAAGALIIPSRKLYGFLTDRIGNYRELEPYLELWKSVPCKSGILEIVVVEHDAEDPKIPRIPKGKDGNSRTPKRTKQRRQP